MSVTKTSFETPIHASAKRVWKVLWSDLTYRKWTSVFSPDSQAQSDWNEGSKILFTDGKGSGMHSIIEKKIPEVQMTFKHIGEIKDGVETVSPWEGALESYFLREENGVTVLRTEMDLTEEFKSYFENTFPKALALVKELSENFVPITIQATIHAPVDKVWAYWSAPEHIMKWNNASDDWHTTSSTNDLRAGGTFSARMEAKDGSFGFDFGGVYDEVVPHELIRYTLGDGRKVNVVFTANGDETTVTETFDAEESNPYELQQFGWQSILNNFKKYTESN